MIPEELMLARIAQSEQMREFFIQMWLQNPKLAEGVGERMKAILRPIDWPIDDSNSDSRDDR
ncbi:hypothetical protein [Endothiovibrio diazotrophicus]